MSPVIMPAARHPRRASDRTGARLGRALLGYLAAVTLVITLAPFAFEARITHGLNFELKPFDTGMNVLMFAPLGFLYQLTRPTGSRVRWLTVFLVAAGFSAGIEALQLLEPSRFSSPFDVAANTLGALLGAASVRMVSSALDGERTVRTLALELPLMGLVYLLVPMMWLTGLSSGGTSRAWLVLPIVAAVGLILGTVHGAVLADRARRTRGWLLVASLAWYGVALLPGAIRDVSLIATGAGILLTVAILRAIMAASYHEHYTTRRFEQPTLAGVAPLFAVYLIGVAGWPWHGITTHWPGVSVLPPLESFGTTDIYRLLEHVAAFSLVGYGMAEWDGRTVQSDRALAVRVAWRAGLVAVSVEVVSAYLTDQPARVLLTVLRIAAATIGGGFYGLQRDHVRALISRRVRTMASAGGAAASATHTPPMGQGPIGHTPPMGQRPIGHTPAAGQRAMRPTPVEIAVIDMRDDHGTGSA